MNRRRLVLLMTIAVGAFFNLALEAREADPFSEDEQILKAAGIDLDGPSLLEFFRKRTLTPEGRQRIADLVRQLGDDSFAVREKASAQIVLLGSPALPSLQQALETSDLEVVRRAEDCIRQINASGSGTIIPAAVARVVARHKPAGAAEALLGYLPFADNEGVADEVRTALTATALKEGRPDPLVVRALEDTDPIRRAAAAEALCRAGGHEGAAVRKLLQDADAMVRLRVALALAPLQEKAAVPVLIDSLAQLPQTHAWLAEQMLLRIADDTAPTVSLGPDQASRRECRDAWLGWWRQHGPMVNLTRLEGQTRFLGYTMVVLLDQGQIMEMGVDGKPRWQIDGLGFPLDAQWLPGDHVLVAEHGSNKVTERDRKGEICWERSVDGPLVAQRLANGHTFIATRTHFLEVNRQDKEVLSLPAPHGELIMRAARLRNGDIACVTTAQKFYRLDSTGKELASFAVDVRTSGGRIHVLSNGHVLIPQLGVNKVVEYNAEGQLIWEAPVDQPVAAIRLPNGNTLVTSLNRLRAVELNRAGKEVWEFKAETRVTRAWRR